MAYINNHRINEGDSVPMMKAHKNPGKHTPPHEKKALIHIEFSEEDIPLFKQIYGDEDEAAAAVHVLMDAPPEIQILAVQLISLIKEVA